jgi:hypothetical protein
MGIVGIKICLRNLGLKCSKLYDVVKRNLLQSCSNQSYRSTRNRRACMRNLMTVEEAKDVCKDRSKWKEVISSYPKGKRA